MESMMVVFVSLVCPAFPGAVTCRARYHVTVTAHVYLEDVSLKLSYVCSLTGKCRLVFDGHFFFILYMEEEIVKKKVRKEI